MINEKENKKISKFLSYVLRHHPETIGIDLHENGWTDIDILIKKSIEYGIQLDLESLKLIVDTNIKKRFSFNEGNDKIRANQGHSIDIDLGYVSQQPPSILYHGTAITNIDSILSSGLEKRERHHVHLSEDIGTAVNIGQRHGKPVIFEISALQMHADDFKFFLSANGVWLTDYVPVKYLKQR